MPIEENTEKNNREKELIRACQRNERKAQYEFYRLYSSRFLGIVYRFAGDYDTANDLLQESFIRIFSSIDKFRFEGSFEGWMKRIVIRTSIDFLKKNRKMEFEELNDNLTKELHEAPAQIEKMNCDEIMNEIANLPNGFRTILNLYAIEGFSYSEISSMLDIKEVTVRSQYMRAKQKLAAALTEKNIKSYVTKIV